MKWTEISHDHADDNGFYLYGQGSWLAPEALGYYISHSGAPGPAANQTVAFEGYIDMNVLPIREPPSPRGSLMKLGWTAVLPMLLAGCGSSNLGTKPTPSPGAKPAVKKELPWLKVPSGRMKTTLFYGPWQCRREFMNECQMRCASEGHVLKGCMWLADLKFDWEGSLFLLPVDVEAGSRYGIYHCCCNYPTLTKEQNKARRDQWKAVMESFRQKWSERFGDWPTASTGVNWPGHHVWDLWHGGNPVDPNNVFPVQPGVHDVYNREYPACYSGQSPWNTVGPDLPYTDN